MITCKAIMILGVLLNPCDKLTLEERDSGLACRVTTQSDKLWQIADFDRSCYEINLMIKKGGE